MARRIVRVGLLVAALGLATVLAVFWWRSGRVMDEWSAVDDGNTLHAVVSFRGSLHVIRATKNSTPRALGWDTQKIGVSKTIANLHAGMGTAWERAGFLRVSSSVASPALPPPPPVPTNTPSASAAQRAALRRVVVPPAATPPPAMTAMAPWLLTRPYDAWVIPYWAPLLAVGPVPAFLAVFGMVRHVARRIRGRCDACGYDLRASLERCPECGYPVLNRRRAHIPGGSLDTAKRCDA
jgi:hypothetical protein